MRGSGPSDLDLAARVQRILDLIWIAGFRSGGRGSFAGDNGGDQSLAVSRAAGPHRNSPYSALRGSIQPVLGSGRLRKARVMHLGHLRGVARCGAACTAAETVLWRWSSRRARVRAAPSLVQGGTGLGHTREAALNLHGVYAGYLARPSRSATAGRRSAGHAQARAGVQGPVRDTGYASWSKRESGRRRSSPRSGLTGRAVQQGRRRAPGDGGCGGSRGAAVGVRLPAS